MEQSERGPFAVVFDLDGTLVDSKQLAMEATRAALEQQGYSVSIEETKYEEGCRFTTEKRLAWHATGDADHESGSDLAACYEKAVIEMISKERVKMFDGMWEIIQELKQKRNVSLAVLSNASTSYVKALVDLYELNDVMDLYLGADSVPAAKPKPDGLKEILHHLNVRPSNCIYIGDLPNDGIAASSANISSVGVTWGDYGHGDLKSYFDDVASTTKQLFNAIENFINKSNGSNTTSTEAEPKRRVSWKSDVIDNENMNKLRTDDEYWDGR